MFKLAILQMRSEKRAYDKKTKTIIDYMINASENNADMLLLPECFITGYDLSIGKEEIKREKWECPFCGGRIIKKNGPYGEFYGCSNYRKKWL